MNYKNKYYKYKLKYLLEKKKIVGGIRNVDTNFGGSQNSSDSFSNEVPPPVRVVPGTPEGEEQNEEAPGTPQGNQHNPAWFVPETPSELLLPESPESPPPTGEKPKKK